MLIELRRPYVDVSAGDLSLTLGLAAAPALEVLALTAGGVSLELRLLGFSHQVLVGGHGSELSETVACVPGVAGSLPRTCTDGAYRFGACVEHLSAQDYGATAAALLERAATDELMLAGLFANAPGVGAGAPLPAFTALAARPLEGGAGVAWTTWHGYPQSGELVITRSALERGA